MLAYLLLVGPLLVLILLACALTVGWVGATAANLYRVNRLRRQRRQRELAARAPSGPAGVGLGPKPW